MWRQILCTIILIVNGVFWVSFIPPRIKALPKKLAENNGLQTEKKQIAVKSLSLTYWVSVASFIIALAAFFLSGVEKYFPVSNYVVIGLCIAGVPLALTLALKHKNLFKEYQLDTYYTSVTMTRFSGSEGLFGVVTVGLAVYHTVLFFIWLF